eukprot:TRINITY_DN31884_c0_g1_i7.p1 TRINITY_DN31884_c0_g1~~TRINITY_DN31884_c0_g1_i7.p1  ORF type:complete len:449 (-),score=94.34 TRINITY_DN31884_c0_g1_i7:293-1639(-)
MNLVIILFSVLLHQVCCENENSTENLVNKIDEEDIEPVTDITTLDAPTEESTVEMDKNPMNSSEPLISKTELDQTSPNPTTVDKEVTIAPSTTESVTDLSDPVKQNILKMFNNLLGSDVANVRETTTDDIDTEEVTRTVTTPMTTPSTKNAATTKTAIKNIITMTTQDTPKDKIKTSTDIITEELTTLSTLTDKIVTTIQGEKIDTQPTTIETIPTTQPSTIKQFKTTTELIATTTLSSTILGVTEQETTDTPDTTTQTINTSAMSTTENLIISTTNTMLSGTTSQRMKQAASEIQETTENISTSVPREIVNMSTTIVTSTEPIIKILGEEMVEAEEMTSMRSTAIIESDEVLIKKAAEEGSTTIEETSEETTTEWFYPTTKPGRSSLYSIVQELPFRNPDNSVSTQILHGAPSKTSQTQFPWIFPKWISNKELSNPNQNPRLYSAQW